MGLDGGRRARKVREARQWAAGFVGEKDTAALIVPLAREGWDVWHDLGLPGWHSANLDHVLIPPCGRFLGVVDSKKLSRNLTVYARGGRLMYGAENWQPKAKTLTDLAASLSRQAGGVTVHAVMAVHGAQVAGGGFQHGEVAVLPVGRLLPVLRGLAGRADRRAFAGLAGRARAVLPPHVQGRL